VERQPHQSPNGDPTQSVAGKILAAALFREPSAQGQAAPRRHGTATLERINSIPHWRHRPGRSTSTSSCTTTSTGSASRCWHSSPTTAAQMVVRLKGNQSIEEGEGDVNFVAHTASRSTSPTQVTTTGASVL
jgi:hypothetical protein